jgi:hypothetical protein
MIPKYVAKTLLPLVFLGCASCHYDTERPVNSSLDINEKSRQSSDLFPIALVTVDDVNKASTFEKELAKHYEVVAPPGEAWFKILDGSSRVMVLAPHATAQMRQGQVKQADGGTGSLAYMLNQLAGCPTIYTTYESPSDPNFYDDNDFKAAISSMLAKYKPSLVLDLHGSHPNHPYDVDFGTMGGTSLLGNTASLTNLAKFLHAEGLQNFSQDFFSASKNQTDTKWVSKQGVPCIQCEINSTWLLPFGPPDQYILQDQRFAELLQGFVRFVKSRDAGRM